MTIFGWKFDATVLKSVTTLCQNFKFVSFELTEILPIKEHCSRIGLGMAGPVHHGYRLYGKKKTFFSLSNAEKMLIVSEISRWFDFPYDCGKKLSTATTVLGPSYSNM